jgi:hypothetical protein
MGDSSKMSKKTLLNETQVRRFMKLANVGALSDGFVTGLSEAGYFQEMAYNRDEEEGGALEDELPGDEGPEDAMDAMGDDMGDMEDMGPEEEPDAMGDAAGESLPPEVVSQVEDALAAALGAMEQELEAAMPELNLSVEQEDDAPEDLGDLGDEPPMGDEPADEPPADMMGDEEPPGDDPMGGDMQLQESDLVERIVQRVAARLRSTND